MRIINLLIGIMILAVSFWALEISKDTRVLNNEIEKAVADVSQAKSKLETITKYKTEPPASLTELYLEVFNNVKEICNYYNRASDLKVVGSKDYINIEELFLPSEYKGVRYVDIICQISLKQANDVYLFDILYEMLNNKPVNITGLKMERDTLNLTMRLYGL